jgi:diaminohydroxyphosphoribosylaminopyrimidine deaminase/5-amino-6-(5-phosphoribosylamino)uracil reductase
MTEHALYIQRCIQLAKLGVGYTAPNPMVGSVVVTDGVISGEGYHEQYGQPHAEVNAIRSVNNQDDLQRSTIYVSLEPCSHHGKTPPCADLIISKKIPRVVIGMQDPFAKVNGEGIRKLQEAGIEVITGVEEKACKELNKRFITFHQKKRPYVILKWAETADKKVGLADRPVRISNEQSRLLTHQWRHEEQAIMVGAGTVLCDNPNLTTTAWPGRSPIRIIVDPTGRLATHTHLNVFDHSVRTIVITQNPGATYKNVEVLIADPALNFADQLLHLLYQQDIQSVLIEGGPRLHRIFLTSGKWDECRIFESPQTLENGIPATEAPLGEPITSMIGDNILREFKNPDNK